MRVVVTAVTAGEEVGRQIVEERDVQQAVSHLVHTSLGQYRDDRNALGEFEDVVITVRPHYRASLPTTGHTHGPGTSGLLFNGETEAVTGRPNDGY